MQQVFNKYTILNMSQQRVPTALGTEKVSKLLMQYAVPSIIAMTASSLYNMVDSIFIGQGVGPLAISGLAVTFPFMNLSAAFGAAIGVGTSTFLSVKLGQRDYDIANRILGNCVMLNIIVGVVFGVLCLLFLDPILSFFGASEQTMPYAREYMEIILLGNAITHLYMGLNALLRSASKPREAMYITIFTVVLNAVLDPLFIYAFNMGIRGAAYATILSQIVALCWQWKLFANKAELVHLEYDKVRVDMPIVNNIISIGISPFMMNACACLVVIFINNSLYNYGGDLAIGAFGISNRIAFVFVMVTMGVCQGMQPIAGYNYGAENYHRMLEVLKLASIAGTSVCAVGFLIAMFLPSQCARMFTSDPTLIAHSVVAMRYIMALFIIIGAQMVITNFFQSIGKTKVSIFLSMSRQLIFLVPLIAILPRFMGLEGVWLAMPLSDGIAAIMAYVMIYMYIKKLKV